MPMRLKISFLLAALWLFVSPSFLFAGNVRVSDDTDECLECHRTVTPGIIADWENSRHSKVTLSVAMKTGTLERRVSCATIPAGLGDTAVGCAECHTANSSSHEDTFEHNGFDVHIAVTPEDCAICHPAEEKQYRGNLMSMAYPNLKGNPLYRKLMDTVNSVATWENGKTEAGMPTTATENLSCLVCHGTKVEVKGMKTRETKLGDMDFPVLTGWPNDGVGRLNPDGSKGSCSACHTRHAFSISEARKPEACAACHKGIDVPAYRVYSVSKHGARYKDMNNKWNFEAVPWEAGKDFTAPTCATCHVSLVTADGETVVKRTHRMNDRNAYRLLGLIYAHPHPGSPDTTVIKNSAGLHLATELTGEPVSAFLIDKKEQGRREAEMKRLCLCCHSTQWTDNHFDGIKNAIKTTNAMTLSATRIILDAWDKGLASGLPDNIFDEGIERMWVEQWLFYANSVRFAAAMSGADYGVFDNGLWYLSKNMRQMSELLKLMESARPHGKQQKNRQ